MVTSWFLRPPYTTHGQYSGMLYVQMAASSKSPPCSHEDINSIFLNSETVLFLHQIFLKGLTARMDSWPTLVLGTSLGALIFHFLRLLQDKQ